MLDVQACSLMAYALPAAAVSALVSVQCYASLRFKSLAQVWFVLHDVLRCCACRLSYGGSLIRPESTGYGTVYFGLVCTCCCIFVAGWSPLRFIKLHLTAERKSPYSLRAGAAQLSQ